MAEDTSSENGATSDGSAQVESQSAYAGTPYVDQSWEVIGELPEEQNFVPLEIEVLSGSGLVVDNMFADYGGIPDGSQEVRWHLPAGLGYQGGRGFGAHDADEDEIPKIEITEEELQQRIAEAEERGRLAGLEAAIEENSTRLATMEERFQGVLSDLEAQVNEASKMVEQDAVKLAVNIAEKLLGYQIDVNPEYLTGIISEALKQVGTAEIRKIRVSPQDFEFVEVIGLAKHFRSREQGWSFEADETVKSGCVVETSAGEIDFQIDAAWERLKDNVFKVVDERDE